MQNPKTVYMCLTPNVTTEDRYLSYMDQQNAFYEKALILFRGDHPKAFAVAVAKIEEFIIKDEKDPRDYWSWIDKEVAI